MTGIQSPSRIQVLRISSTVDRNFGSTSVPPSTCYKELVGPRKLDLIEYGVNGARIHKANSGRPKG